MAKSDKPRKERVAPDEARERLTNATIELLKTEPIPKVTTRRIAEVSGLSLMAIARIFGDHSRRRHCYIVYGAVTLCEIIARTLSSTAFSATTSSAEKLINDCVACCEIRSIA